MQSPLQHSGEYPGSQLVAERNPHVLIGYVLESKQEKLPVSPGNGDVKIRIPQAYA